MVSLKDVARKAGVSASTVSRVMNDSSLISPETKAKVREAILELNYQPNLSARNLRCSDTKIIMCMLVSLSNFFMTEFSECFLGMRDMAVKHGYKVILCPVELNRDIEREYLDLVRSRLVDGVIFVNSMLGGDDLRKIGKMYPCVQCSEYNEETGIPSISINNVQAAKDLVGHLIETGHRRIGMISSVYRISSIIQREEGYKQALKEARIPFDPGMIKYGMNDYNGGIEMTNQFLGMDNRPTAIFCISDAIARGCTEAIAGSGLRIPEDMAVAGFDNSIMSRLYWPKITTVSQPVYELGGKAVERLISILKGDKDVQNKIVVGHQLIVRESTVKNSAL
ncbi:MAG: LacI family transcriptional regulator [Treponema sp.]|jgi:LacI family repressor for deo operon, udp, cdd, tsx, nupC, and nupG|nr:LacI family transcriptional regulator [Treponema sp.]